MQQIWQRKDRDLVVKALLLCPMYYQNVCAASIGVALWEHGLHVLGSAESCKSHPPSFSVPASVVLAVPLPLFVLFLHFAPMRI